MKDKLQLLINDESNLTRSAFAEMLGIQPATISHILAGRNKPSYELLQKILMRFPNVSSDWLMVDRGEMLRNPSLTPSGLPRRDGASQPDSAGAAAATVDFDALPDSDFGTSAATAYPSAGIQGRFFDSPQPTTISNPSEADKRPSVPEMPDTRDSARHADIAAFSHGGASVERVVVFYSDKTFDTYIPKK